MKVKTHNWWAITKKVITRKDKRTPIIATNGEIEKAWFWCKKCGREIDKLTPNLFVEICDQGMWRGDSGAKNKTLP